MEIIRVEHVDKIYADNGIPVHALRDINLTIDKGEFLVIAGPSGSGKTTLLNVIGALDKPTNGKIFLENIDIGSKSRNDLTEFRLHNIGFVFQAYNLIPVLNALENIEFALMLMGQPEKERRARALEVMTELEIDELALKRPSEMSGGQQQRVAVARAIVGSPSIVLADEPTANLDSGMGGILLDMMETMNRERNITFIFSSHDHQVIERAGRLVLLKDGSIDRIETRSTQ